MNNKIKCPLMDEKIDEEICFDISMVAEGEAPTRTAPDEATKKNGFKEICLKCQFHRFE